MQPDGIIVHYAEVATKGRNRPQFIKRLASNIGSAIAGLPLGKVERLSGRLWIRATDSNLDLDAVHERISTVYGLSSYSPALRARNDLDDLKEKALRIVAGRKYDSFRVTSRRVFKDQPLGSLEVDREVGGYLHDHNPVKVKLKGADLQVFIEMMPKGAYMYADKFPCRGGLPVGMSGRVACLLSGGIDSPVAAARMQRRGCTGTFIHFHSHPFLSRESQDKAVELATHLAKFQRRASLYLVPFGELQREIVTSTPTPLRVILYRRFMLRIASRIAESERARALVTGESLAQVASQTLTNMLIIDTAATLPVLRPLIGYDKQEIIAEAQQLGTFETSIIPDQDCCTLFVPKNPETHAKPEAIAAAEAALDIDALCDDAIARTEQREVKAPWLRDQPPPEPNPQTDPPVASAKAES